MTKRILYHAAVYLRLSREDGDTCGGRKTISNSIESQRALALSFMKGRQDLKLFDIYTDDGYSGADFDRPDFNRMMADIRAGRVNCVIVKDLSRFGRDYIEAGRYIQKTFPAFSVRFIAITDHYDSLTADQNTTSFVIPVKNFVNDSYCRDISNKVKSQQKVKREQGKFIGAFAVYGYRKDPEDRNKLVCDDYAAGIVKNIFAWKLDGMSSLAIAKRLNGLGILSPLEYKKAQGEHYATGFQTGIAAKWSPVAVKRILTNELYTGTMVQGKREKVNHKLDRIVEIPESEWIRVPGTHMAVISAEDYRNVQRLLKTDMRAGKGKEKAHLFAGLLFCGDCKETMVRRVRRDHHGTERVHYICSTKNRGEGCTRHSIPETDLFFLILEILKIQTAAFLDGCSLLESIRQLGSLMKTEGKPDGAANIERESARLKEELEKYSGLLAGLYEDLAANVITQTDLEKLRKVYGKRKEELQEALAKQEALMKRIFQSREETKAGLEGLGKNLRIPKLDRAALLAFVERVEIYENKSIIVRLRFCDGSKRKTDQRNGAEPVRKDKNLGR